MLIATQYVVIKCALQPFIGEEREPNRVRDLQTASVGWIVWEKVEGRDVFACAVELLAVGADEDAEGLGGVGRGGFVD